MTQKPPGRVAFYIGVVASLAVSSLAGAIALQVNDGPPSLAPRAVLEAVAFVLAFFVLGQTSFTFTWRGHRHRMVLDEIPLYVGLLALSPGFVILLVGVAALLEQARMRRAGLKAAFNLSQGVLASAIAVGVFLALRALDVPEPLAAMPAAFLYPLVSTFLVAGVFARMEGARHSRVFMERFVEPSLVAGAVGAGGGIAIATLYSVHPLTLLSLGPFAFLTYRYGVLAAVADRELDVHKRLAEATHELVGAADLEQAARSILRACGDAFPTAGRAELVLDDRAISETFGEGADPAAAAIEERVPGTGRSGGKPIGTLRLYPRRASVGITEVERALVRIVTAQLGAAIEGKRMQEESARQREALAQNEKLSALGTLVAGVAHEINNPVTYMRGALELADMDLDEVAAAAPDAADAVGHARVSIARLKEGVQRVERITHSLKAVARQGNGERAPEDLRAIAEDVAQVVRVGLPKGVRLDSQMPDQLPLVHANASELHQVILNLVKNAAEALAATGGNVEMRAWAEGDAVLVEVADDGPGIPDEVQRRLFEPFFTTKRNGTGLGLSLSKGIVEAHGGELLLDSAPGRGTRFTMRLPVA